MTTSDWRPRVCSGIREVPDAPVYVCSLVGESHHWSTTGASSVYNPTPSGFRINLCNAVVSCTDGTCEYPPLEVERARRFKWRINWIAVADRIKLENQFKGGASWFFWIVGLSVVNSLIVLFQGEWSFAIGLAVADGAANRRAIMAGAFVLDLLAASVFVLFGVFARKSMTWAFVVGLALYAIDGLILLLAGDLLGMGFHGLGLWGMWGGLRACRALKAKTYQATR